jgi:hypothetical protein
MNPDLAKVLAVILALVGLVGAIGGAWYMVDSRAYARGQAAANAVWQAREAKELAAANAQILMLEEQARRSERAAHAAITSADQARRKADETEKARIPMVAGSVAAGLERLCNGGAAGQGAVGSTARPDTATSAGADAANRTEFFAEAGDFFTAEAARADAVTRLLEQAQAYIRTALETCNAP